MGDKVYINGDKQAVMIEFELSSSLYVNLYIDLRKSSAKEGLSLKTNMLLALS